MKEYFCLKNHGIKKGYRKGSRAVLIAALCLTAVVALPAQAAEASESKNVEDSSPVTASRKKSCWIKKGGKYYWLDSEGVIYVPKKQGIFSVGNKKYYLNKDGSRVQRSFKKIKGKYYYFDSDGKMYCPKKNTLRELPSGSGKKYYVYKDGHAATGLVKIKKNYYYFSKKGVLQKDKRSFQIKKSYYDINEKGVAVKLSGTKLQCRQAARSFIKKHSGAGQTNAEKFRSCFNYLMANMKYTPGYYNFSDDYKIIDKEEGAWELALSTFNASDLRGNCHRFACCVAAIAAELGYKDPTVVFTTGDHSFVMIDGRYYDNMYGGLFGADSRPGTYKVYKKTVF